MEIGFQIIPGLHVGLWQLIRFTQEAKINTYATGGGNVSESRVWIPGNTEHEYSDDYFYYRDSYCGYLNAPGREWIRLRKNAGGRNVWSMSYDGGMNGPYDTPNEENDLFAKRNFEFLKLALAKVPAELPLRGPSQFRSEEYPEFIYNCHHTGTFERFSGAEEILYWAPGKKTAVRAFYQRFSGGKIVYR